MLIDRYLLRLIAVPFAATLGIFLCLLLLIRMADLLNYVINEGGSFTALLELLLYLVPQYLALALPVGLLTGVVLAFRRLALGGEWDAMLAGGVATVRLLRAPLACAAAVSLAVLLIAGFLQPLSLYAYEKLRFDLEQGKGGISVAAGEFRRIGDDLVVRARESRRDGTDLRGVFVSMRDGEGSIVLAAQRALLQPGKVTLVEGRMIRLGAHQQSAAFETYEIPIVMPAPPAFRARGHHQRELILTELLHEDSRISETSVGAGLGRRAAQAGVVFILPFLGIALARPPRRGKGGEGLFVGLALYLVFNELSLFGERMGVNGQAPPILVQGVFLAIFAALALALFSRVAIGPSWSVRLFRFRAGAAA